MYKIKQAIGYVFEKRESPNLDMKKHPVWETTWDVGNNIGRFAADIWMWEMLRNRKEDEWYLKLKYSSVNKNAVCGKKIK